LRRCAPPPYCMHVCFSAIRSGLPAALALKLCERSKLVQTILVVGCNSGDTHWNIHHKGRPALLIATTLSRRLQGRVAHRGVQSLSAVHLLLREHLVADARPAWFEATCKQLQAGVCVTSQRGLEAAVVGAEITAPISLITHTMHAMIRLCMAYRSNSSVRGGFIECPIGTLRINCCLGIRWSLGAGSCVLTVPSTPQSAPPPRSCSAAASSAQGGW
jgi:hypothetical protein